MFCANDPMALGFLRAAAEAGRRVPQDISVVGFNNVQEAAYFSPPLTTVRQNFGALGEGALHLLMSQITPAGGARHRRRSRPSSSVRSRSAAPTCPATPLAGQA